MMKKLQAAFLLFSSLAMLGNALPVKAADSLQIAYNLRPGSEHDGLWADGTDRIYVTPQALGNSLHFGIYLETDTADVNMMNMAISSDCPGIQFVKEGVYNPVAVRYAEAQTFTLPDGTAFSTQYHPSCIGMLDENGVYKPNGSWYDTFTTNSTLETSGSIVMNWNSGYSSSVTEFLGGVSDAFSITELEMPISTETEPGVYHLNFQEAAADGRITTYFYTHDVANRIIPETSGCELVVMDSRQILEEPASAFRYAEDTAAFSPDDFAEILPDMPDLFLKAAAESPAALDVTTPRTIPVLLGSGTTQLLAGTENAVQYQIGLRGDANGDGIVNAADAAQVLTYSAAAGAGEKGALSEDAAQENLLYFLADIDGASRNHGADGSALDAQDAAYILTYAAIAGSGDVKDWDSIAGIS